MVMGDTVQRPGGDAAVVRVHGTEPRPGAHHRLHARATASPIPSRAARQAVAEAWRNLVAVGARPLAITNCLNFGNPERPRGHGPARRLHRGHGRGLPGARLPGRLRQRLALQRDRRQRDPADAQCRRPRPDRATSDRMVGIALGRSPASSWSCWASAWAGSAARSTGADRWAATTAPPPPVDLGAERRTGEFVLRPDRARAGSAPATTSRDGGLAVAAGRDVPGRAASAPRSSRRPRSRAHAAGGSARTRAATCWRCAAAMTADAAGAAAAAGCIARVVGRSGGDALITRAASPHIDGRAAGGARGLAAGLHGGRGELSEDHADHADERRRDRAADQAEPARRRGADRGSGRRRRSLPRPHRLRAASAASRGCSSTSSSTRRWRAHGRRAACAGPDHVAPRTEPTRQGTDRIDDERSRSTTASSSRSTATTSCST